MTDELDKDLAKALQVAKKKPRNFAIITKGANVLKLLVDKKPIKDGTLLKAKKEVSGNAIVKGVVSGAGAELVFQVVEEPSIAEPKLKKFITDTTRLTLKPRFEVVATVQEVDDDSSDEAVVTDSAEVAPEPIAAPEPGTSAPPPSGPSADQLIAALNKLSPAISQAVADHPDRKAEILKPVATFQAHIKAGELSQAKQVLLEVGELLKTLKAASVEAPAPPESAPEAPAQPDLENLLGELVAKMSKLAPLIQSVATANPTRKADLAKSVAAFKEQIQAKNTTAAQESLKVVASLLKELSGTASPAPAGETPPSSPAPQATPGATDQPKSAQEETSNADAEAEEFKRNWAAARKNLRLALDKVEEQLTGLADALLKSEDPNMIWVAENGLSQILSGLRASATTIDKTASKTPAKTVAFAKPAIAELEKQLASERVKVCDQNNFGAKVTIKKTITTALEEMMKTLDSVA